MGSILPARQLLASLFPDSGDLSVWKLASPSRWSSRKPWIGAWIRHGRQWFYHCQHGHYSTSRPDSPAGDVPLEHSQQWQGCQHGHTRTSRGYWWWPFPTPGSDLLGGRFGSPCQSPGGIYTNIVGPSPSHGGISRRGLVSFRINSIDDSSLYFEAISTSGNG